MDTRVTNKKLGLKDRYAAMTRGLGWETSYQPMDKVFPQATFEGIKIHDWDKWEDPFRLTMDSYWKYQAEKERKLYAVLKAMAAESDDNRAQLRQWLQAWEPQAAAALQPLAELALGASGAGALDDARLQLRARLAKAGLEL